MLGHKIQESQKSHISSIKFSRLYNHYGFFNLLTSLTLLNLLWLLYGQPLVAVVGQYVGQVRRQAVANVFFKPKVG
jgi:hypothetical protein